MSGEREPRRLIFISNLALCSRFIFAIVLTVINRVNYLRVSRDSHISPCQKTHKVLEFSLYPLHGSDLQSPLTTTHLRAFLPKIILIYVVLSRPGLQRHILGSQDVSALHSHRLILFARKIHSDKKRFDDK